ncbi:CDP-glycerol glycerophosphotransferase family protein [Aeromonas enteropelogenes]|uniref:CDP-glycerol glycerophosphotransferase family protein n=1 Tax=Aeromonas enteropelogenes TaxID=29489 RepID=UPI003B9F32AE
MLHRFAFFVHTAEMVNHYKSVWTLLGKECVDILLWGAEEEIIESRKIIEGLGYSCYTTEEIISSGYQYEVIISNHSMVYHEGKPLIHVLGKRRVRFMYALGKAKHNLSDWNNHYDLILCFGPWQDKQLKKICNAVTFQMGYPRYDEYFTLNGGQSHICDELGLDKSKKTILWLPTWREISSLPLYADVMCALCDEYNVIVKTHPLSARAEPEILKIFEKYDFTKVITHVYDNLKLFQCCDFVVCDYGGTPFGALYLDKNLILLNVPDAEKNELTGEGSPDIDLRREIVSVNVSERWALPNLLNDELLWEAQREQRKKLRKVYFVPTYGFSSELAVLALKNIDVLLTQG